MSIERLLAGISIPRLYKVKQIFEQPRLACWEEELLQELRQSEVLNRLTIGQRIAIAVGTREIRQLPDLVRILVRQLRAAGAEPFIVSALSSDEAATAEGQKRKLHSLGIDENTVGAPVRSTQESVFIGESPSGIPVFMDRYAYEADGIIVINLVRPNACLFGGREGGLMKIIAMGLGKQLGAVAGRHYGHGGGWQNIDEFSHMALQQANFLFGLAVVENACNQPAYIKVLHSRNLYQQEDALQQAAKRLMPRLHLSGLDVLVVDEIGSHVSDNGLDTGIVGTNPNAAGRRVGSIAVLDIGEASRGNGMGLGFADYTTARAFGKFNFEQTYQQALQSGFRAAAKIPMVLANDRLAIQAAIQGAGGISVPRLRLARIKNTAALDTLYVSAALYEELRGDSRFAAEEEPAELAFDAGGNLF